MAELKIDTHELHIPLEKCKPYPGIPLRFDMEVPRIGESIHVHGQQEPGTAVKNGEEYLIADGRRRLLGCRYSYEKYGSPSTYWARVYEGLDEIQIFTQAFVKNDERKSLSLLEEVDYFREAIKKFGTKVAIQIGIHAGRPEDYMKRVHAVCDWIEPKLVKLHKIEVKSEHRFKLLHLESLSVYRNDEMTFYQMAAVAAARKINPSEVDPTGIRSLVKYYAPWFGQEFPEYMLQEQNPSGEQTDTVGTGVETETEETSRQKSDTKSKDETARDSKGERHLQEDIYLAECPHCGAKNPFQFRWNDSELIFVSPKDDGNPKKEACVPDSLYVTERRCLRCGKAFKLVISPKGQSSLAMATHKRVAIPGPQKTYTGKILVWDPAYANSGRESEAWLVVSGDSQARFINGKLVPIKD